MTAPILGCRVALASNPFDATPIWTEIGTANAGNNDVSKVRTRRGRERLLRSTAQFQAGTLECALKNRARKYDPTNTVGPYYPNIQPEKLIQIYAIWAGVEYKLWTGYVDDWPQVWAGFAEAAVPLLGTDLFKQLSTKRLGSAGYSLQVLADSPAGYYRLGDPAGSSVAADSSGNGNNLAVFGLPVFGTPGGLLPTDPSGAMQVNAPISGISGPSPIAGAAAGYSIEFLMQNNSGAVFIELFAEPQNHSTFWMYIDGPGGNLWAYPAIIGGGGATWRIPLASVSGTMFHHLVFTVSPTEFAFSLDGVRTATPVSGSLPSVAGEQFRFGNINAGTPNTANLVLDELALYRYPLTAAQIANHYRLMTFPVQTTGARANQILDTIGHPASQRRIDTGRTTCGADHTDESQVKALTLLQKCEQTEQGQVFIGTDGYFVFEDRYHRYLAPNGASKATFGDGGAAFPTEIPYVLGGVTLNFDRAELFNEVPVTRRGATSAQTATDQASITAYTQRTMPGLADLLMAADADALYCAQWILAETRNPQFRVGALVLNPFADTRLWPLVLGLEIGDVVTVNKHNIPGPGPNLLSAADADMESGLSDWNYPNGATVVSDSAHAYRGAQSVKMTPTAAGAVNDGCGVLLPVTALQPYALDAFMYVTDPGQTATILVSWYTPSVGFISASQLPSVALTANTWNELGLPGANTLIAPAGAGVAVVYIQATVTNLHPLWFDTVSMRAASVKQSLPALSLVCRIEGIEHQIDPPLTWKTTWHLSLSGTLPWLILDDPVAGLLDHGNRVGW